MVTSTIAAASVGHLPAALTAVLVAPADALARGVQLAAEGLAEPPHWALLSPPWLALLGALGLCCSRLGRVGAASLAWIVIALTSASPVASGPFDRGSPRVVFFDVGQGDAALVQSRHASLLIDSGPGPPDGSGGLALVRALHALGLARLDVFAVTHGDLDHRGGAIRILGSLPVAELWLPESGREDDALKALAACARAHGTRVRWLGMDAKDTRRGDLEVEVLWPDPARPVTSRNETSLVLRVRCDGNVSLFTADIGKSVERMLVAQGRSLAADILKVAHHGSRRSSSLAFLKAVSPSTVILSAPCDPTRGLPNGRVLDRLRDLGATLGWTGRDGALSLARGAGTGRWTLRTWGRARRCRS